MKTTVAAILVYSLLTGPLAHSRAQVFTSPQGEFRIAYSLPLVRCLRDSAHPAQDGAWLPDSCRREVCEDPALPSASTVACVAYGGDEFSQKVAFGAGAFFVAAVAKASTKDLCLQGEADWNIQSRVDSTINDEPAVQFRTAENWMMHSRDSVIDRVFRRGACYEIGIQRVHNSTGPFEAGTFKEFTAQDEATVQHRLREVLRSFRFLN
ncbi:MAG: hypothetical protein WA803_05815 [Steroidobacteraceae bacterium]